MPTLSDKACISRIKYLLGCGTKQRCKDLKPVRKRMTGYLKMLNELCDLAPPEHPHGLIVGFLQTKLVK